MRILKWVLLSIIALVLVYFLGPTVRFPTVVSGKVSPWDISLDSLDTYVKTKDLNIPNIKPDNESRIIWADSIRKTRFSIVYLHGFSASPMESNPTHINLARKLGCNLYIPLLSGHGILDKEAFANLTPNDLIESAKEALAIGQLLGEDVILMSCSTGGTLSIYLAAANAEMVDGLIMYSPNISLADPTAKFISGPWGKQIVNNVIGKYWIPKDPNDEYGWKYWSMEYRTEGLIALQALLDETMKPEIFDQVTQPYFAGYYYKDDEHQDKTISTAAIIHFNNQTSTPPDQKVLMAFPNAGEHVMANPYKGQDVEGLLNASLDFAQNVLKIITVTDE
ncbi:MAG: alpha/beta hydrolase [Cyclobacteriaceae bacterium]